MLNIVNLLRSIHILITGLLIIYDSCWYIRSNIEFSISGKSQFQRNLYNNVNKLFRILDKVLLINKGKECIYILFTIIINIKKLL